MASLLFLFWTPEDEVARKKTVVDDMIDDVKDAATSIGEAVGMTDPKQVERIVQIPPIDVYSELPFPWWRRTASA